MLRKTINIFEYVDYRFFLRDYCALKKKTDRTFSQRSFAIGAGVPPSALNDILSGRQNLSASVMQKYADAMHLDEKERDYFNVLVAFNNSKDNTEKNRYFGEMVRCRGRSAVNFMDYKQYDYFSTWYNPVVREMVTEMGYGDDAEAIAAAITPRLTPAKVRKSIKLLSDLGLIHKDPEGRWVASNKVVSSEYELSSLSLKNYQNAMLDRAREALDVFPSEKREFQGMTLSASRETFAYLKERLRGVTDEVLNIVAKETEKPETVFQINMQMFPFVNSEEKP